MSTEHQPEHRHGGERSHAELEAAAHRQLEHLRRHEHHREHETDSADKRAEAAREALRNTEKTEHHPQHEAPPAAQRESNPQAPTSHILNPRLNYAHTMASVQRRLAPVNRSFSRFIHRPAVERVSESLERTVARPSVTAGATWTALIVGSVFYFTARNFGYALSGSEILLSFLVGAVIGLLLEMLWRTIFRRPRR